MKAVILAAGRGSRLKPLTNHIPKTLLQVGERSILRRQVEQYAEQGIEEIRVVTGYRANDIAQTVETLNGDLGAECNIGVIESSVWDETDNLYSLYLAEDFARGDPFVLSNGDVVAEREVYKAVCSPTDYGIAPFDSTDFEPEELKLKLEQGKPTAILDKGKRNGAGSTIGMFAFDSTASEALFSDIESNIEIDSERMQWFEASLSRIFLETDFKAADIKDHGWAEIDTEEDLKSAWERWAATSTAAESYLESVRALDETSAASS